MSDAQESGSTNSPQAPGQGQAAEPSGASNSPQTLLTDDVLATIREEARRAVQAKEDRATARLEKSVAEIAEMVKRGMTPDQIEDRMLLDQLKAERQGTSTATPAVASTNATTPAAATTVDYVSLYKALDLDPNDLEVLNLTKAHPSPAVLVTKLAELKITRASSGASLGAVVAPSGAAPNTLNQIEQKTRELEALNNAPIINTRAIQAKKDELQALQRSLG